MGVGEGGGIRFDRRFFLEGQAVQGRRPHQIRLEGVLPPATRTAIHCNLPWEIEVETCDEGPREARDAV